MSPFWKAALISLGVYAGTLALGFAVDFRITLFLLLTLQFTWTLFCAVRSLQLRHATEPYERADFLFAFGGLTSSLALFALMVVLTQVV